MNLDQRFAQKADELRIERKQAQWFLLAAILVHIGLLYLYFPVKTAKRMPDSVNQTQKWTFHKLPPQKPEQKNPEDTIKKTRRVIVKPVPQPSAEIPVAALPDTGIITNFDAGDFTLPDPEPLNNEPIRPTSEVTRPVLIHSVQPKYPEIFIKLRIQGNVGIEAVISKDGDVTQAKVTKSLHKDLDQYALEAVKQFKYHPALLNDSPIAVRMDLEVNFTVQER